MWNLHCVCTKTVFLSSIPCRVNRACLAPPAATPTAHCTSCRSDRHRLCLCDCGLSSVVCFTVPLAALRAALLAMHSMLTGAPTILLCCLPLQRFRPLCTSVLCRPHRQPYIRLSSTLCPTAAQPMAQVPYIVPRSVYWLTAWSIL